MTRARSPMPILVALSAILLGGCTTNFSEAGGIKKAVGLQAEAPDEFLVVQKAPLIVPPDMNLRPPRPGAEPIGMTDPRLEAQASLTGRPVGAGAGASAGEQAILARANANEADPTVRDELLREQGIATKDKSVTDRILARQQLEAETLDPYSEANRLRGEIARNGGTAGGQTDGAAAQPAQGQASAPASPSLLDQILGSY